MLSVKAREGDQIVCSCGVTAGSFRHDVGDHTAITGEDISVAPSMVQHDAGYPCLKCGKLVAEHIGPSGWRVNTSRGWVQ